MERRTFIQGLAALGVIGSLPLPLSQAFANTVTNPVSVDDLPKLKGDLTLYLGRGEGVYTKTYYKLSKKITLILI